MSDAADIRNDELRPIGVRTILLAVAAGLVSADLFEYLFFSVYRSFPANLATHMLCEMLVLLLVFLLLYKPIMLRREQRQRLTRALQTSEDQYRTLVEGLDIGIALIDDQRQMIKSNQAMTRFMGEPGCYVSQRKCYELMRYSAGKVCDLCPGTRTLATGQPAVAEMSLPVSARQPIQVVRVSTFPVPSNGSDSRQFIEVVEDISAVKKAAAQIQRLTRDLNLAAENERKRMARDLHDQCGQMLAGVQYNLEALRSEVVASMPVLSDQFERISSLVEQIGHSIRQVSTQLHPSVLDDLGLVPTLNWLVEDTQRRRPDIEWAFSAQPVPDSTDADFNTTLYRICQESLNNICKHSQATQAQVVLTSDAENAILQIRDNGCGFDVESTLSQAAFSGHVGLHGMRERVQAMGGVLNLSSAPGEGTLVEAEIPLAMEN